MRAPRPFESGVGGPACRRRGCAPQKAARFGGVWVAGVVGEGVEGRPCWLPW